MKIRGVSSKQNVGSGAPVQGGYSLQPTASLSADSGTAVPILFNVLETYRRCKYGTQQHLNITTFSICMNEVPIRRLSCHRFSLVPYICCAYSTNIRVPLHCYCYNATTTLSALGSLHSHTQLLRVDPNHRERSRKYIR